MKKKEIYSEKVSKPIGPYSQGIAMRNMVFTAGQIHSDQNGNLIDGSIEIKTHKVMENIKLILEASGTSFEDVVKTTVYLVNFSDFSIMNEVYASYFKKPYPARETIEVKSLPKGAGLEISMIAIKNDEN